MKVSIFVALTCIMIACGVESINFKLIGPDGTNVDMSLDDSTTTVSDLQNKAAEIFELAIFSTRLAFGPYSGFLKETNTLKDAKVKSNSNVYVRLQSLYNKGRDSFVHIVDGDSGESIAKLDVVKTETINELAIRIQDIVGQSHGTFELSYNVYKLDNMDRRTLEELQIRSGATIIFKNQMN